MAAPPPTDGLIAALLAAVLGVFAPAAGFVVTVLKPAATTACSPTAWEDRAQQLVEQLGEAGSADAQSLRQQLAAAGVTAPARQVAAQTTTAQTTTARAGSAGWQELAAKLSAELAASTDPEARTLAQAIGDTGTPDGQGGGSPGTTTTRARSTGAPSTSAPGAARPMPGDAGSGDTGSGDAGSGGAGAGGAGSGGAGSGGAEAGGAEAGGAEAGGTGAGGAGSGDAGSGSAGSGGTGAGDPTRTPAPTAPRSPGRTAAPSTGTARPGTGPCPAPPDRGTPAPDVPSTADSSPQDRPSQARSSQDPSTRDPSAQGPSTSVPSSGARATTRPAPTGSPSGPGRRWEQLAAQLAAALAGSTDPRAADLRAALQRAGFPASTAAPRTTAIPVPDDPGGGG